MKVSSINFPIYSVRDTRMWPCQSVRVQHWLFEWQQPILLDYVARLSAYIVSDETTISECSVDAYAHELSALTIVHTYSTRSLKYACAILTSVPWDHCDILFVIALHIQVFLFLNFVVFAYFLADFFTLLLYSCTWTYRVNFKLVIPCINIYIIINNIYNSLNIKLMHANL